jgi:hypothetical protein
VRALSVLAAAVALSAGTSVASATAGTVNPDTLTPKVTTLNCGHGVTSEAFRLPKGFNPLTATNAELLANNLPPPPSGAHRYAIWKKFVEGEASGRYHTAPTCSFKHGHRGTPGSPTRGQAEHANRAHAVPQQTVSEQDSGNWAGNVATDNAYFDTYGTYQVPIAGGNGGIYESSSWVGEGLGTSNSDALVQAGTESDFTFGVGFRYDMWWEVFPELSQQVLSTNVEPGDTIWVHIHYENAGSATMTVLDENRGEVFIVLYKNPVITPDDTAEWILERTDTGGTYPMLPNYSTTTFTGAEANYGLGPTGVGNLDRTFYRMYNCQSTGVDTQLAAPGPIGSNGTSFTDNFENNGIASPACPGSSY